MQLHPSQNDGIFIPAIICAVTVINIRDAFVWILERLKKRGQWKYLFNQINQKMYARIEQENAI